MLKALLMSALAAVTLSGCGALGALSDASVPLDAYDLRSPSGAPVARGQAQAVDLIVEVPTASGALDTDRILVRPSSSQVQYLPGSRWTESAPVMIQTALVEGLERSGGFRYVGRRPLGSSGDYAIVSNLTDFQAEVADGSDTATIRIRLTARLVREEDASVVSTRVFEASGVSADTSNAAIVAAFDQATSGLYADVIGWVLQVRGIPATAPALAPVPAASGA